MFETTTTTTTTQAPPKRRRTFVTTIRVGGEARLGPRPERERLVAPILEDVSERVVVGFSR